MKEKNTHDPSVDGRIELGVRVVDHTLDILRIHLDCEVCHTKNENANCSQSIKQPVQLELHLQVVALNFCETNGTKAIWILLSVIPDLQQNKLNHNVRSIDGQDNLVSAHVVQSMKHRGMTDHILKMLHH